MTRASPFEQPAFDRGHIADTTAQLCGHTGLRQDRLDRCGVDGFAFKRAVQVDKVQPFTARVHKFHGLCGGIVVEHGGAAHIAMHKAHGLSVFEVNRGVKDHAVSLGKVSAFLSPTLRQLQRDVGLHLPDRAFGTQGFVNSIRMRR